MKGTRQCVDTWSEQIPAKTFIQKQYFPTRGLYSAIQYFVIISLYYFCDANIIRQIIKQQTTLILIINIQNDIYSSYAPTSYISFSHRLIQHYNCQVLLRSIIGIQVVKLQRSKSQIQAQIITRQTKQHVELDFGALVDQRLSQQDIQKETSLKSKQLEEQLRAEVKQQFSVIQQMQAENENLKESVLVKDRLILNLQRQLQKQKEENEAELKEMREMVLEMQQEIAALGEQME
ncbi:Hypothetical_protein [Hexamita inflata]|uniref:Hypothetical_protein n=1 Tax=Hexamita inflata TaxID=28002 RepID=A0AA86U131_9EUKA|nr:Hypothetical protein HINF_LOCUS23864 [Hexamita inflata]